VEHDEPMGVITTRSEMGAEGPVPPLRTLWQLLETYHSLVYYAPERADRYARLGLAGGWMGYFATRSAALGTVPPSVVTACFYGFAHRLVARALPDAWTRTTPADALAARYDVVDAAATRLLGPHGRDPRVAAVAELLVRGVGSAAPHGRPMFAAHAHLPCPDAPHLALFWAATALRELRGDAHVVALQATDLSPAASNVLMTALRLTPGDQRTRRGWTETEWADATDSLRARGWLTADGDVTLEGRRRRAQVELVTDRLVDHAWAGVGEDELALLTDVLGDLVQAVVAGGGVPHPNGIGVPRVGRAP